MNIIIHDLIGKKVFCNQIIKWKDVCESKSNMYLHVIGLGLPMWVYNFFLSRNLNDPEVFLIGLFLGNIYLTYTDI